MAVEQGKECFISSKPHLTQALTLNSRRHNAHKNMGVCREGCGEYVKAVAQYAIATQINPRDHRAFGHLEQLVERLPRLLDEIPELPQTLKLCRQAVQQAKIGWS